MIKWPFFIIELFCNGILYLLDLLGLKVQNIQNAYKKSSIIKNYHFIITYLAQIKKLENFKFLDL